MPSVNDTIDEVIKSILAMPIEGCITGSSLLDMDKDKWSIVPDVDVFCYGRVEAIRAIDYMTRTMEWKFGASFDANSERQQQEFFRWMCEGQKDLNTVKVMHPLGIVVNVSVKKYQHNMLDVIGNFDQTCIMKAVDIPTGAAIDLTEQWCKKGESIPNPLRKVDGTLWNTAKWIRQWDRVTKYGDREIDCRKVGEFYLEMINKVISSGPIWNTERCTQAYDEYVEEFVEIKDKIVAWLDEMEVKYGN